MIKNGLPIIMLLALFASCSSAYRTTQTPDDVYYSPGKAKAYADVQNNNGNDQYITPANSDDQYLHMMVQNRAQWNTLDNSDYWYSPNYAYNNYYAFNSFNPYSLNSWGLSYYYSPFASIQPYGWFNSFYPSYGYGFGYSPYSSGFYGVSNGYGYYGYSPVSVMATSNRTRTSRPLLGAYTNTNYSNYNSNSRGNRYVPASNGFTRYNNSNNSVRYNNNTNNSFAPSRSYTPSSSGSSGGGVGRQGRH